MNQVNLILCLHNHQPVGNFDHVFEENFEKSYYPFLKVYENFTDIPISLHYSGCLFDWLIEKKPEFMQYLKKITSSGNVEFLSGTYYEAILTMLTDQDRLGQIKKMSSFLKERFDQKATGFWLTERVWEQEVVSSLFEAGIKYTIVDDKHFKNAGLSEDALFDYFITEDQGNTINIFATNENLRYMIPYTSPEEILQYFRSVAEKNPDALLVYADDGEKFGGWPDTYDWVYHDKWLEKFLLMLRENKDWVRVTTPREVITRLKPAGKIYLPDNSYREMTEWSLPVTSGKNYENVVSQLKEKELWDSSSAYLKGGFWRNFKYKYPEVDQMYARMMEVSSALRRSGGGKNKNTESLDYLYKAQCNCPYWHGVFGGVYLNHLRFQTYKNLIKAEKLLNKNNTAKSKISCEEADVNFDGRPEIIVQNEFHKLYIQPHSGGRIYEWDFLPAETNITDTISRREEVYHADILNASETGTAADVQSIHDINKVKDLSLKNDLIYDDYERKSFIDHIIVGEISAAKLRGNEVNEPVILALQDYEVHVRESGGECIVEMNKSVDFTAGDKAHAVHISKSIRMQNESSSLEMTYTLTNEGENDCSFMFGSEWNFAMLAGDAPDRYYFYDDKDNAGNLISVLEKKNVVKFGIIDEWQNIKILFASELPTNLFVFPIESVSQSESSYEKVYQSSVLLPVNTIHIQPGEKFVNSFAVSVSLFG